MSGPERTDLAGGLILALRGAVLVVAGAALWHWPVGGIAGSVLAVLAVAVLIVAALAFLVAAAAWRNALVRALAGQIGQQGGRTRNIILALPFLAALAAISAGLFIMVGRLFV